MVIASQPSGRGFGQNAGELTARRESIEIDVMGAYSVK